MASVLEKVFLTIGFVSALQLVYVCGEITNGAVLLDEWVVKVEGGIIRATEYARHHDLEFIDMVHCFADPVF